MPRVANLTAYEIDAELWGAIKGEGREAKTGTRPPVLLTPRAWLRLIVFHTRMMSSATPQQSGSTRDQALRRTRASQPRFFLLCGLRGARRWCLSMGKRPHLQPSPEEVDVAEIRREWGVPPMFEIRAPGPNDRASQPPPGFIVVFLDIWRDGFRVPIPAFQQQLLQAWDCRPCHLLPNANDFGLPSSLSPRRYRAGSRVLPDAISVLATREGFPSRHSLAGNG